MVLCKINRQQCFTITIVTILFPLLLLFEQVFHTDWNALHYTAVMEHYKPFHFVGKMSNSHDWTFCLMRPLYGSAVMFQRSWCKTQKCGILPSVRSGNTNFNVSSISGCLFEFKSIREISKYFSKELRIICKEKSSYHNTLCFRWNKSIYSRLIFNKCTMFTYPMKLRTLYDANNNEYVAICSMILKLGKM